MGLKRTGGGQERESFPGETTSTAADTTELIFTSGALQHPRFQTNIRGVTDELSSPHCLGHWKSISQEGFGQEMLKKEAPEFKFSDRFFFPLSSEQKGALMSKLRTKQAGMCEELSTLTVLLSLPAADFGGFLSFFSLYSPCGWGQVTWEIPYFPYF